MAQDVITRFRADTKDLVNKVNTATGKAKKDIRSVEKETDKLGAAFKKAGTAVLGFFAADQIINFTKQVIQVRGEFQRFAAVLSNTLGSNSKAQKALKDIQAFAAQTPFAVAELTGAFVKLANQGFKPTTAELRKLGDIAASTGKSFDQLAEAIIDAQVGEFERLKEFGIRAQKEGDKVTFTFKGVKEQVDFTSEAIQGYILSLGDAAGVSGAMEKISKTLEGRISNLGDAFDTLLNQLGRRGQGLFSTAIQGLTDFITAITPGIDKVVKSQDQLNKQAIKTIEISQMEIKEGNNLLASFDRLNKEGIEPNSAEQLKLNGVIQDAITLFGDSVVQINEETGALELNRGELEKQITARTILENEAVRNLLTREQQLTRLIDIAKNSEETANAITRSVTRVSEDAFKEGEKFAIAYTNQVIDRMVEASLKGEKELRKVLPAISEQGDVAPLVESRIMELAIAIDDLTKNETELKGVQEAITRLGIDRSLLFSKTATNANKATKGIKGLAAALREDFEPEERVEDIAEPFLTLEERVKKALEGINGDLKTVGDNAVEEFGKAADEGVKAANDIKEAWDELTDDQQEQIAFALQSVQELGLGLFNFLQANREQELADLEKQKEAELEIAGDNEQAREAIEEKFAKKTKELKKQAAEDDKAAAIFDIVLSTAVGIQAALSTLNPALAALIAASGAIQLATVIARPIPQFAQGTPFVKLNGNPKGRDTVPAMLDEGERVISAKNNKKNWHLYNAIERGELEKYIMQNYVLPQINPSEVLGKSFAENVGRSIKINNKFHDRNIVERLDRINTNLSGQKPARFNPRKI